MKLHRSIFFQVRSIFQSRFERWLPLCVSAAFKKSSEFTAVAGHKFRTEISGRLQVQSGTPGDRCGRDLQPATLWAFAINLFRSGSEVAAAAAGELSGRAIGANSGPRFQQRVTSNFHRPAFRVGSRDSNICLGNPSYLRRCCVPRFPNWGEIREKKRKKYGYFDAWDLKKSRSDEISTFLPLRRMTILPLP